MNYDNSGLAALGIGFIILMIVIYLAILALALWVSYLIMRTAVKNGVLMAMQQSGQQFPPQGYRPPAPPQGPYQAPPTPPTA